MQERFEMGAGPRKIAYTELPSRGALPELSTDCIGFVIYGSLLHALHNYIALTLALWAIIVFPD